MKIILPEEHILKVFLDTSVIISGIVSLKGASGAVLDLCEAQILQMIISRQVLTEADRNFGDKLPDFVQEFRMFIQNVNPVLVPDPTVEEVKNAEKSVNSKDAPILACAIKEKVQFLITLDKRFRITGSGIFLKIISPGDFLKHFRKIYASEFYPETP